MILRRLTEHFKSQNWFAVGLELIVVIVGIYIGLQADAWMSAKRDRALEVEYLERLVSDMDESILAQKKNIEAFDSSIASIDYIAQLVPVMNCSDGSTSTAQGICSCSIWG